MKIQDSNKPIGGVSSTRTSAKQGKSSTDKPKDSSQGTRDQVSINPLASTLQAAETALADTPVMDVAKVEGVRQEMERGQFAVDSGIVAERLIQSAIDSLRRQGRSQGGK